MIPEAKFPSTEQNQQGKITLTLYCALMSGPIVQDLFRDDGLREKVMKLRPRPEVLRQTHNTEGNALLFQSVPQNLILVYHV